MLPGIRRLSKPRLGSNPGLYVLRLSRLDHRHDLGRTLPDEGERLASRQPTADPDTQRTRRDEGPGIFTADSARRYQGHVSERPAQLAYEFRPDRGRGEELDRRGAR